MRRIFFSLRGAVRAKTFRGNGSNTTNFAWYLDSNALLVAGHAGTLSALWRLGIDGSGTAARSRNVDALGNFDGSIAQDGAIAFVGSTPDRPGEIYYRSPEGSLQRLTDENAVVAAKTFGHVTTLDWKGPGGLAEDGVLTLRRLRRGKTLSARAPHSRRSDQRLDDGLRYARAIDGGAWMVRSAAELPRQ